MEKKYFATKDYLRFLRYKGSAIWDGFRAAASSHQEEPIEEAQV